MWVVVWLLVSLGLVSPSLAATPLRVGVYANPPLQSFSEGGIPEGLVIDILETIAQEEGWQLTYVPCIWEECLAMLEVGDIDLMGAIAYSAERAHRFTFNQETLLNNWGHVYTRDANQLESVLALDSKRIAILKGDIHAIALQNMLTDFDIAALWVEVDTYADVFTITANGDVDAGVVNHFFAIQHAENYDLHASPIIFNPIEIRFATTLGTHAAILESIDNYLGAAKANENSVYYSTLDTWFGVTATRFKMPDWARWLAFGISGAALLLLLISLGLRHQVRAQTRQLRESQERLDLAIRGTDVGLWDWNIESGETVINEKWASMIGYTLDELSPVSMETWNGMAHPDDLAESQQRLQAHFSGENEQYECEVRLRHKDGHWVWVLDRGRVFERAKDGRPLRMAGTQLEITQRKVAEADLAYNKQLFQALMEQSREGIGVTDLDGKYILVNPAFSELTGYSESELLTMQVGDLMLADDEMELFPKTQRGENGVRALRLQRKDGSAFFAEVSGSAITIEGQRFVLGTVRNIDTRIEWEAALQQRADELAALYTTTLDIIAPHELPKLLKTIVRRAMDLLKGTSGGMYLADEERQRLRCVVSCNTPRDYTGVTLAYGEGAAGTVAATGDPLIVDDYRTWDKRANIYESEQPFSAIISVPMRWQERVIGVIHVMHDTETRTFNPDDLNLLSSFANQAAIAVENARLLDELHKHTEKLEARVRDRTAELQIMVNAMSGREVRMAGLKKTIKTLRQQLIDAGIKPAANDPLLEQSSGGTTI
ncbi:MAG: PAS domain S-box protein [Anaerolineae bacterium]|nr:PAS domain S-box protein [Anaerolineae bacterium]